MAVRYVQSAFPTPKSFSVLVRGITACEDADLSGCHEVLIERTYSQVQAAFESAYGAFGGCQGVLRNVDTNEAGLDYLFSKTLGSTTQTTTRLVTIKARATKVMRKTLPLLAGNLPRMIQYWIYISACVHYNFISIT